MEYKKAWYERNKERLKQEYREKNPVKEKIVKYLYKDKNGKCIYEYDPAKRHEKHMRLYKSQATIYNQQERVERKARVVKSPVKKEEYKIPILKLTPMKLPPMKSPVKKEYKIPIERIKKRERENIRQELTYEKDAKVFYNFNILHRLRNH